MYTKNSTNTTELIEVINMLSNNPELVNKIKDVIADNNSQNDTENMHKSIKSKGKAKRPLEDDEYENIIKNIYCGFKYIENGKERTFKPNEKVALALILEATLGIRISDIVKLKVSDFNNGKMQIIEKKTNKLQYRKVNQNIINLIYSYAFKHNRNADDLLIGCTERNIQIALKKAVEKLNYRNIGTHSFRKYFSMYVYKNTKDIQLLQHLLNHSSIATTQRYLGIDQVKLDEVSSAIDFSGVLTEIK